MTKDQFINKWLNECDPKQRDHMKIMLTTLDIIELCRYFFLTDNNRGMSTMQIANKYNTTQDIVKYQIAKAKKMGENSPTNCSITIRKRIR